MQDMQDQAVGWYRDPGRPKLHRYWNGHSWVGPEAAQGRLPRQAVPRRTDDRGAALYDLPARDLVDTEKDA
jgi:hypothetical protein